MARILVIDDNFDNREILTRMLERRQHEVTTAPDGALGLVRIWTDPPDLILLDLSLPVFDGWALARQLKAAPETRHIPIIAVTAHALDGDAARARAAGCDEYEPKPINRARLDAKIATLLAARAR